jgi:hypothetical protein
LVAYSLTSACLRSALSDIGSSFSVRSFGARPSQDVVQRGREVQPRSAVAEERMRAEYNGIMRSHQRNMRLDFRAISTR